MCQELRWNLQKAHETQVWMATCTFKVLKVRRAVETGEAPGLTAQLAGQTQHHRRDCRTKGQGKDSLAGCALTSAGVLKHLCILVHTRTRTSSHSMQTTNTQIYRSYLKGLKRNPANASGKKKKFLKYLSESVFPLVSSDFAA